LGLRNVHQIPPIHHNQFFLSQAFIGCVCALKEKPFSLFYPITAQLNKIYKVDEKKSNMQETHKSVHHMCG
jgi:hypothetical protein